MEQLIVNMISNLRKKVEEEVPENAYPANGETIVQFDR